MLFGRYCWLLFTVTFGHRQPRSVHIIELKKSRKILDGYGDRGSAFFGVGSLDSGVVFGNRIVVYDTIRFFQYRGIGCWWRETGGSLWRDGGERREKGTEKGRKRVTRFQSACTALAATIGTGNIAGVATALTAGGPGGVVLDVGLCSHRHDDCLYGDILRTAVPLPKAGRRMDVRPYGLYGTGAAISGAGDFVCLACGFIFSGNGKHGAVQLNQRDALVLGRDAADSQRDSGHCACGSRDSWGNPADFQCFRKADAHISRDLYIFFPWWW